MNTYSRDLFVDTSRSSARHEDDGRETWTMMKRFLSIAAVLLIQTVANVGATTMAGAPPIKNLLKAQGKFVVWRALVTFSCSV